VSESATVRMGLELRRAPTRKSLCSTPRSGQALTIGAIMREDSIMMMVALYESARYGCRGRTRSGDLVALRSRHGELSCDWPDRCWKDHDAALIQGWRRRRFCKASMIQGRTVINEVPVRDATSRRIQHIRFYSASSRIRQCGLPMRSRRGGRRRKHAAAVCSGSGSLLISSRSSENELPRFPAATCSAGVASAGRCASRAALI